MLRSATGLTATAILSLGVLAAPVFAQGPYPCSNGNAVKIVTDQINGVQFDLKASCKGSWSVYYAYDGIPQRVLIWAQEVGTQRECSGKMETTNGFTDIDKQKIECKYDSGVKVKIEIKRK